MAAVTATTMAPAACRALGPRAAQASCASSSSAACCSRQARPALCSRPVAPPSRRWLAPALAAAADDEADPAPEELEEDLEFLKKETIREQMERLEKQAQEQARLEGKKPVLRVTDQVGLKSWAPAAPQQQPEAAGDRDANGAPEAAATVAAAGVEELVRQLPGLPRELRLRAEQQAAEEAEEDEVGDKLERYPRKKEPQLTPWDLRAKMEKRRRQQREWEEWNERRARVGQYPNLCADWRTDIRIQGTGDPTDPTYREWTHKEIWDLITLNGRNVDPREVKVWVRNPLEIADAPAQGAEYRPDPEEYFASLGRLIKEEDLAAIAGDDKDGEVSLLAAEFSDFDDELVGAADLEAEYGGEEDEVGADEDGF